MNIKITTLIENNPDTLSELAFEHGLSMYIEADDMKILFDTGQTGKFVDNAKKLGKSLRELDCAVISHGHYDHSGGLMRAISSFPDKMPLYVGDEFFIPKYKPAKEGGYKFIGNGFVEEDLEDRQIELIKVQDDKIYLSDNIMLFHHFDMNNDYEKLNPLLLVKDGDEYKIDSFPDEMALGIKTARGLVVIVGCSHDGIVNILNTVSKRAGMPIYAVIGGTHLVAADEERIDRTIEDFRKMEIRMIAVSHCTGDLGMMKVHKAFANEFILNNTGQNICINLD